MSLNSSSTAKATLTTNKPFGITPSSDRPFGRDMPGDAENPYHWAVYDSRSAERCRVFDPMIRQREEHRERYLLTKERKERKKRQNQRPDLNCSDIMRVFTKRTVLGSHCPGNGVARAEKKRLCKVDWPKALAKQPDELVDLLTDDGTKSSSERRGMQCALQEIFPAAQESALVSVMTQHSTLNECVSALLEAEDTWQVCDGESISDTTSEWSVISEKEERYEGVDIDAGVILVGKPISYATALKQSSPPKTQAKLDAPMHVIPHSTSAKKETIVRSTDEIVGLHDEYSHRKKGQFRGPKKTRKGLN